MVKKINLWPDCKVLEMKTRKCIPVTNKEESDITELIPKVSFPWEPEVVVLYQDLLDTADSMKHNILGLSSNQIWDKETPAPAMFIVKSFDAAGKITWLEFINPVIKTSGNTVKIAENCLSYPGYTKRKTRELNVKITFNSINSTEEQTVKLFGKQSMLPIIIQHEYDHLQGKVF